MDFLPDLIAILNDSFCDFDSDLLISGQCDFPFVWHLIGHVKLPLHFFS